MSISTYFVKFEDDHDDAYQGVKAFSEADAATQFWAEHSDFCDSSDVVCVKMGKDGVERRWEVGSEIEYYSYPLD